MAESMSTASGRWMPEGYWKGLSLAEHKPQGSGLGRPKINRFYKIHRIYGSVRGSRDASQRRLPERQEIENEVNQSESSGLT